MPGNYKVCHILAVSTLILYKLSYSEDNVYINMNDTSCLTMKTVQRVNLENSNLKWYNQDQRGAVI